MWVAIVICDKRSDMDKLFFTQHETSNLTMLTCLPFPSQWTSGVHTFPATEHCHASLLGPIGGVGASCHGARESTITERYVLFYYHCHISCLAKKEGVGDLCYGPWVSCVTECYILFYWNCCASLLR